MPRESFIPYGVGIASVIAVLTLGATLFGWHLMGPHRGAVTHESLREHVSTAREERKEIRSDGKLERQAISLKIDHIEDSIHALELEQAPMAELLENIYEEVRQ